MVSSEGFFLVQEGKPEQAFELRPFTLRDPSATEVVIEVEAFGLNYADVMARNGIYADAPAKPCVLGYEVVGKVIQVGEEATHVQVGDRVVAFTLFGGYARHALADHRMVQRLPDTMNAERATALATQYVTAYYSAILRANMQEGEHVLVHAAAGGVGTALVQLAKWKKCEVWGTAGSPEKLEYLRSLGVAHPINYREKDYVTEVQQALPDDRLDVVFNPIGGKTYQKDRQILARTGRHVIYGVSTWSGSRGNAFDKMKLAWEFGLTHPLQFLIHSQSLIGVNLLRVAETRPIALQQSLKAVIDLSGRGILNPVVKTSFTSEQLSDAHHFLEDRKSIGKIAVRWV